MNTQQKIEVAHTPDTKPNCYRCKFRKNVSGDTHSACSYGDNELNMFDFNSSKNIVNARKLDIQANSHGIRKGWFLWPINFDPIWLTKCDGFIKL